MTDTVQRLGQRVIFHIFESPKSPSLSMVHSNQQHYAQMLEIMTDVDKVDQAFRELTTRLSTQDKIDILMVYGKGLKLKVEEDIEEEIVLNAESTNVNTTQITKDVIKAINITNDNHSDLLCISNRLITVPHVGLKTDREARLSIKADFNGCCLFEMSDELDVNHVYAILQTLNKHIQVIFLISSPISMLPRHIKLELNKFELLPKVVQWNGGFIMENLVHYYILLSKNAKEKIFPKFLRKLNDKRIIVYTAPSSFHYKMNQLTGNSINASYIGPGKQVGVEEFNQQKSNVLVTTEKHIVAGDYSNIDLILNMDGSKEGTKSYLYRTGRFKSHKHIVLNMITEVEYKLIKGKPIGALLQPLIIEDVSKIDIAIRHLLK